MAYAVGQTVEVCLEFDLPLARGVRFVVATFANERGDVTELTEMPAGISECLLQGWAPHPGFYEMKRLRVEHLRGVTYVDPPEIGFEVKGTPEV
jgi:hypothetical protein